MGKYTNSASQPSALRNSIQLDPSDNAGFSNLPANSILRLAEQYFSLAIEEYQRHGDEQEINAHFRNSGLNYLNFYSSEELPEHRDVLLVYYRALPCVVCFCDESDLNRFTDLEEWRFCWPPIDVNPTEWNIVTELNIQSNVRRYLREVIKFIDDGKLDEQACSELHSFLQSSQGVDKMSVAKELSLGILALQAIHTRQEEELRHHLLNLIKSHQQRAKRGQLRGDSNGAIAMQALMLASLARQKGLSVQLAEQYPPLLLLDR